MAFEIRKETAADIDAIRSLIRIAFRDMPYASGTEQDIVDRLRAAGDLTISLVAELDEELVGHIAFSPATSSEGSHPWFGLGPVAIDPKHQRKGIGSALIRRGLTGIRSQGAAGCILVGDPGYYKRFDFEVAPANSPDESYASNFMIAVYAGDPELGSISFHKAFSN
jgi:predicted N-acetyltransferase YhbS